MKKKHCKPAQAEIDAVLNRAYELIDTGENPYFGLTYADGVKDAIEWLRGNSDQPLEVQP